ncbi:MAG: ArsA family ATPase, partial [Wenzhouxiangellaceae bacterium]|nr:ArsA family ATPase [Wenzhouxiangellaceae bacterium]
MLNHDARSLVASIIDRRFVFCGGKGGVGKTSIAAALGMVAARAGRTVRVISTDPAHSLGDVFECRLDHRPTRVEAGLEAVELDPDKCMDAYLDEVARRLRDYVKPALYGEIDRQMEQARHSPGAAEAALLEEIAGILAG